MAPGEMAEARPETPKKYSCACGLSQDDRKRQFSGKCRHCHTRPKFLRAQSSFDSGSAARGMHVGSSPVSTPSAVPNEGFASATPTEVAGENSSPTCSTVASCRHSASSSGRASNTAQLVADTTQPSTLPTSSIVTITTASALACPSSSSCQNASLREGQNDDSTPHPCPTRRRSRSVDRYDVEQLLEDPPPYNSLNDGERGRISNRGGTHTGVRRTESEDTRCSRRSGRRNRRSTPPPSYEAAQNPNPPSYEEALATQVSGLSLSQGLSALIAITPDLRTSLPSTTGFIGRPTSLLASFDIEREVQRVSQREAQREAERQARRIAQRQAERELQIERERERERELERERMRELQVAQYCGCSKCQSLYYSYYYNEAINDGTAFPMETQVIMQEVLADGLAFCSLM